jgi:hypothetical protein
MGTMTRSFLHLSALAVFGMAEVYPHNTKTARGEIYQGRVYICAHNGKINPQETASSSDNSHPILYKEYFYAIQSSTKIKTRKKK